MSDKSGIGTFLGGFLVGAVIGTIGTVLYAPKSGEETRAEIRGKKDDIAGKANLSVDDAYKQAETAAREARDRFETLAAATREHAENITRKGQVILEEQINNFKKTAQDIEEDVEQEEILMPEVEESEADAAAEEASAGEAETEEETEQ